MNRRALVPIAFALVLASWAPAAAQAAGEAQVARITLADFKTAFDAGRVITLDVRDADSYAAGHIPGALSVPLDAVPREAAGLKGAKKIIVAYCAWPDESISARAALDLAKQGVPGVKALLGGLRAWSEANYPLTRGAARK